MVGTATFGRELDLDQRELDEGPIFDAAPKTANEAEFTDEGARIPAWVEGFVRRILQSKTRYSFFLHRSISQSRDSRSLQVSTALFPIPIPFFGIWDVGPRKMNSEARHLKAIRKLIHVAVMALNYTHDQSVFHCLELLRRRPSRHHLGIYRRLGVLIKASVHSRRATIASCGRKSSQFIARLRELYNTLHKFEVDVKSKYHQSAAGQEAPVDNSVAEELRPYRSLQADRLKIVGEGAWRCEDYLDDLLFMPFMEPRFNQFDVEPPVSKIPDCTREDPKEILKLASVWDARNLLHLVPEAIAPDHRFCTRVFNNYKNSQADRQIGDRRSQNFREGMLDDGPSKMLPSGTALLQIMPRRFCEVLRGSITDRRDYYHQFAVPWERAITNCTFPLLALGDLKHTKAYVTCLGRFSGAAKKRPRDAEGDFLGVSRVPLLVDDSTKVSVAFGALYQGDHLGVEFACSAHARLLQTKNLLQPQNRLVSTWPIVCDEWTDGLVIDDYFVVARQGIGEVTSPSASREKLEAAKGIYAEQRILGSDDKDVWDELLFKVVGSEIDSRPEVVRQGAVLCGAPSQKRLGIATVAASVATLPYTSDALHASLVGSLVSMAMFRRPVMSILNEVFHVIDPGSLNTEKPELRPLSRKAAEELVLFASLCPVLVSNLAAEIDSRVFATDASMTGGGITETFVPEKVAKFMWRAADRKGKNLPLLSAPEAILQNYDPEYEPRLHEQGNERGEACPRPIGMKFDFVEICGGSGRVSQKATELGLVVAPVLDITYSPAYNLKNHRVICWLNFLLESGRLLAFLVAPPCTTFSPAAYPPLRTYKKPLGLYLENPRVVDGTLLAHASLSLMFTAKRTKSLGMAEQPRRSKMRWLRTWVQMIQLGAKEVHLASCAYGSPHQKEFTFLYINMDASCLHRRCTRDHVHVKIQGQHTKPSAVYCDGLASALASVFVEHIHMIKAVANDCELEVNGLESPIPTDVAVAARWRVRDAWRWKKSVHINLLETSSTLKLFRSLAKENPDSRFVYLSDSHVARSALARGRTSSIALRQLLKQQAALTLAFGLYPAGDFVPTRVMPADAPSREKELEEPVPSSFFESLTDAELLWIASLPKMKRWASNWVRLVLLSHPGLIIFHSQDESLRKYSALPGFQEYWTLDFDSTLGYPGEGPSVVSCLWIFVSPLHLCFMFSCCGFAAEAVGAWGAARLSHGDRARQLTRSGIELGEGRRITDHTSSVRVDLLTSFKSWLAQEGRDFDSVFLANPPNLDLINKILSDFGRTLFEIGKPYYHYSETINAVSGVRPILRRSLQQAWDLAAMWGSYEPTEHHIAMPYQILLAILSVCMTWGWMREGACFALAWGALLRIGEIYNSTRKELILPHDVSFSIDYALLKITEPKTRYRSARHQAGKIEQPDLIQFIALGFGNLKQNERLWPYAGSTLRLRFNRILHALNLPCKPGQRPKPLSLASFRPGGATWLIGACESAETVRRRGRWASYKTMEIYLQEVTAATYLNEISAESREKVTAAMHVFVDALETAKRFQAAALPTYEALFKQQLFLAGVLFNPTGGTSQQPMKQLLLWEIKRSGVP